jgi:hypothetical protein
MIWEKENIGRNLSGIPNNWKPIKKAKPQLPAEPVYFDFETFKRTLQNYESNIFIQNLLVKVPYPFDPADVTKVIELYRLGTISSGYRAGAITFPFIDISGNVRAVQVKQFDETNHTIGTDFLHSILTKYYNETGKVLPEWLDKYVRQEKKVTCIFGEHLLREFPSNPIALVEAPKTAVYGTLYFGLPETPDQYLWLAVYNKSSFSLDKMRPLRGRFVYVFPDLSKDGGTFLEWETKAKEFERQLPGTQFKLFDFLEHEAPEIDREHGLDIADYLIRQDWRAFRSRDIKKVTGISGTPQPQPESISDEIDELERWFNGVQLPPDILKSTHLSVCYPQLFVKEAVKAIRSNNGNVERLWEILFEMKDITQSGCVSIN